ncbi:MAG: hypothetical protein V4444_07445 [Pseudomonadota bacterium]
MIGGQFHGKSFEDWVKGCRFPGSSDSGRSNTAEFDVEAKFDRDRGLPTSIKSGLGSHVALSDARRFWKIDQEFRLLFGHYRQNGIVKHFDQVHEFLITPEILSRLRGELDAAEVERLHFGLSLSRFPVGKHVEARSWARSEKARLAGRASSIVLNPKIDSKTQRRLQCSIKLRDLIEACETGDRYFFHDQKVGTCLLPFRLESAKRKFGAKP